MKNRKFSLLMMEFAQLNQDISGKINDSDALVCQYGELHCRIENGARVGLNSQLLIMVELLDLAEQPDIALQLNANFHLTSDGYIANFSQGGCYYIRNKVVPEHPQELLRILGETVTLARKLNEEIKRYVAD